MMGRRIKILIVDDSQAYRMLLRHVLESDPQLEVISHAVNGRLALPRIKHMQPDFVILDQEMPEMDGLETLSIIRRDFPRVGVIMFSSHTVEGARITLKALEKGALDFVAKPAAGKDPALYIHRELVLKIKNLYHLQSQENRPVQAENSADQELPAALPGFLKRSGAFDICVVGISTGGPVALRSLLGALPRDSTLPVLIVQHMPPLFTRQLAESLNEHCAVTVCEARNGMRLEPRVYIAPGGQQMELSGDGQHLLVGDGDPELICKPSVNVLFSSVARSKGLRVLGLIMTGMGEDGYTGCLKLHQAGATILAQNKESSVIFGMPARPIAEGLAQARSLDELCEALATAACPELQKHLAGLL